MYCRPQRTAINCSKQIGAVLGYDCISCFKWNNNFIIASSKFFLKAKCLLSAPGCAAKCDLLCAGMVPEQAREVATSGEDGSGAVGAQ